MLTGNFLQNQPPLPHPSPTPPPPLLPPQSLMVHLLISVSQLFAVKALIWRHGDFSSLYSKVFLGGPISVLEVSLEGLLSKGTLAYMFVSVVVNENFTLKKVHTSVTLEQPRSMGFSLRE